MSENIIIQEGGVGKNLNAIKKIQTADQGGGSVYWIPEEDIELGDKTIKKNGTYYAKTDDLTGYAKVFVNVPGGESRTDNNGNLTDDDGNPVDEDGNPSSGSGKPPVKPSASNDGGNGTGVTGTNGVSGINPNDGNEYHVTKNPNTGELIYTKIPSYIRVTKNPDKTSYEDGQTINPSGIVVHAYYADGGDHGTVLNSELAFEPLVADSSKVEGGGYTSELDTGNYRKPIPVADIVKFRYDYTVFGANTHKRITYSPTGETKMVATKNNNTWNYFYFVSSQTPLTGKYTEFDEVSGTESTNYWNITNPSVATIDGKTVYYAKFAENLGDYQSQFNSFEANFVNDGEYVNQPMNGNVAWTIIYGSYEGGGQPITVKWNRPTDGKTLTDTFNIDVSSSASEESGGGGSHGF